MLHQPMAEQVKNHAIAIISLIIAIVALTYNTWREESTERNRNIRLEAFEVLKNLGQLQVVVNATHYAPGTPMSNAMLGWGHISLISDLSQLLPAPIPETTQNLVDTWNKTSPTIKSSEEDTQLISEQIDKAREAVLKVLGNLH